MCEHCENSKPMYYAENKGMIADISILEKGILTIDLYSDYVDLPINHCPNCGRFLGENKPLTIEEIYKMDKEIVWVSAKSYKPHQCEVRYGYDYVMSISHIKVNDENIIALWTYEDYGKTWTAFRHEKE